MYMLVCTVHMYIPQNLGKTAISYFMDIDTLSSDVNKLYNQDKMSSQRVKMSANYSFAQRMSDDRLLFTTLHVCSYLNQCCTRY